MDFEEGDARKGDRRRGGGRGSLQKPRAAAGTEQEVYVVLYICAFRNDPADIGEHLRFFGMPEGRNEGYADVRGSWE